MARGKRGADQRVLLLIKLGAPEASAPTGRVRIHLVLWSRDIRLWDNRPHLVTGRAGADVLHERITYPRGGDCSSVIHVSSKQR